MTWSKGVCLEGEYNDENNELLCENSGEKSLFEKYIVA